MPFRRKFRKQLSRKVKHSGTFVANIGNATVPQDLIILKTSGGPRSVDGAPQTIQSSSSTDENCKTGDKCSLVNLHIQAGARPDIGADEDRTGWLEWALICVRENETVVPSTRTGVQTLGDICTNMYRGECIYTGAIPIGVTQPVVAEISLKIPKQKKTMKLGDEWRFITLFRSVDVASTGTQTIRLLKSWNLKIE